MKIKQLTAFSLLACLLASLLLAACGDTTSTTAPAPAATTAATAATTAATSATTAAASATTAAVATTAATSATTAAGTAATTAAASSGPKGKVVVGSKNFTESKLVAEMYALALENAGIPVERKIDLGSTDIAHAAIVRGDISLYPEYTGTALLNVIKLPQESKDPKVVYNTVAKEYASRFKLTVLDAAPMNNSNGIAVTKAAADKYNLKTLSDLAAKASELRFAAIPDFIGPRSETDGLKSLQKTYGGFNFKEVKSYEIPLRYQALQNGQADAVVAFTTDGEIAGYNLVLMEDDKNNFPPYQFAPVVREDTLAAFPNIKTVLNTVSAKVTTAKISALNWKVDGPEKKDAIDVAKDFLKSEGLVK